MPAGFASLGEALMDSWTQWLIGLTAAAVIGYIALIYGSCALDARCQLRTCGRRVGVVYERVCGAVYDRNDAPLAR
jgi:hypothetical protein